MCGKVIGDKAYSSYLVNSSYLVLYQDLPPLITLLIINNMVGIVKKRLDSQLRIPLTSR